LDSWWFDHFVIIIMSTRIMLRDDLLGWEPDSPDKSGLHALNPTRFGASSIYGRSTTVVLGKPRIHSGSPRNNLADTSVTSSTSFMGESFSVLGTQTGVGVGNNGSRGTSPPIRRRPDLEGDEPSSYMMNDPGMMSRNNFNDTISSTVPMSPDDDHGRPSNLHRRPSIIKPERVSWTECSPL
jgi:hypothetical protein